MVMPKTSQLWVDEKQSTKMIDIGGKKETLRRALAHGRVKMNKAAFFAIKNKTNPKGDVLTVAEIAGIGSAKKASEIIPLCHPLLLESISVKCIEDEATLSIFVTCEVSTFGKTGVEMEALSGVNGACLAIYDLSKIIDPSITISDIKLLWKDGGKNGHWENKDEVAIPAPKKAVSYKNITSIVVTLSDRVFKKTYKDLSGPEIVSFLSSRETKEISHKQIPDSPDELISIIKDAASKNINLIITTGGTGLGPRDKTPETISKIADREIYGVGELLRSYGAKFNQMSWLSRSSAWQVENTLVIALPGSRNGVIQCCSALEPLIPHLLSTIEGGGHE